MTSDYLNDDVFGDDVYDLGDVHRDVIADQWVFGRQLFEDCFSCLYVSMCSKTIYCNVNYYVQI